MRPDPLCCPSCVSCIIHVSHVFVDGDLHNHQRTRNWIYKLVFLFFCRQTHKLFVLQTDLLSLDEDGTNVVDDIQSIEDNTALADDDENIIDMNDSNTNVDAEVIPDVKDDSAEEHNESTEIFDTNISDEPDKEVADDSQDPSDGEDDVVSIASRSDDETLVDGTDNLLGVVDVDNDNVDEFEQDSSEVTYFLYVVYS